jgi:hypothetical protein
MEAHTVTNDADASEYRFVKWFCASAACIPLALLIGGSQPFILDSTFNLALYFVFFGAALLFCLYVLFLYRQKDPTYKFGWKLVRLKGRTHGVLAVLCMFPMAAMTGYLLLFPTEIALAYVARAWDSPMRTVSGVCESSYRYKLRGPGNEIKLLDGRTVRLYGYPMICGEQLTGSVVLTVRASPIGMWVTRVDPAR